MELSDERWGTLLGGHRIPYDPVAALRAIQFGDDTKSAWAELWEGLHHQGDVDEASYAAVTAIAELVSAGRTTDWNAFAIAVTVETARRADQNPPVPGWMTSEYAKAWGQLFDAGLAALPSAADENLISSILAVLACHKGQVALARVAMCDETERQEMIDEIGWG